MQSISIVFTAYVIVSSLGVRTSCAQTLLPFESSQPFYEWLVALPQSQDAKHPGYAFLQSARAILEIPADGRQRFLMPRSKSNAKRISLLLDQAFAAPEERVKFQQFVQQMQREIERSAEELESRREWSEAYRLRWLASGFAELTPSSKAAWSPAGDILQPKRAPTGTKGPHPITQWPASSYQLVLTPNFEIAFQTKQSDTSDIVEICEQTYAIWKQLFYSYWSSSSTVGPDYRSNPAGPFQVIIFRNKENYLKALQSQVRNVAVSTGYYHQNAKACFFYMEDRRSFTTMVHELTHQFFIESSSLPIQFDSDQTGGFWAAEGIALYMESLSLRDMGASVLIDIGGWDSSRLQAGRFRFLRDQMWFPWDAFGSANGIRFRSMEDIAPRYSQACGLAHYWMENSTASKTQIAKHLDSIYRRGSPIVFEPNDDELIMKSYFDHLRRGPRSGNSYLPFANRNELVLSRCDVDSSWLLDSLASKRHWDSIDVSFSKVDDEAWVKQGVDWDIVRLNVESSKVTDSSIESFSKMPRLQELDLSNCSVTDKGVASLRDHKTLRTLWLAGTSITDQSIAVLATLPRLEAIHVPSTNVSSDGWQQLLQAIPRLRSKSTGPGMRSPSE
jgi:hypothetical protein